MTNSSSRLTSLNQIVAGNSSLEAAVMLRDLERKMSSLHDRQSSCDNQLVALTENKQKYEDKINKIKNLKINFPIDSLKEEYTRQSSLHSKMEFAKNELLQIEKSVSRLKDDAGILSTVPCGDEFPTCPFIKKAFISKTKIGDEEKLLQQKKDNLRDLKTEYDDIVKKDLLTKIKKYESLLDDERMGSIEISKIEVKIDSINSSLNEINDQIESLKTEIVKLEKIVNDSTNLCDVYDSIKEIEIEIEKLKKEQLLNAKNIGSHETSLETLITEKSTLEKDLEDLEVYELINVAMSKKGLPSQIISKMLPQINLEIQNILFGVCNFTVELEVDDDSNSLEIYINYGDKRRIIELGSGMEKMISAIATRVALISMSSLPKSNIFIIDEGFGALDDTNLEACTRLLKSLKKYFSHILIISHVDAIKDSVDNFIDINWIDGGASVKYS
jgi:DNA repair exonuclease SbcCD ATPase subunit